MRNFVNALDLADYEDLGSAIASVQYAVEKMDKFGVRCDVGHPHRFWEYGSAVTALIEHYKPELMNQARVLDVGAGWSPLGPTLSLCYGTEVVEAEADISCGAGRGLCNTMLASYRKPQLQWMHKRLAQLRTMESTFDAVFCISVLEHVARNEEQEAWEILASKVRPGGLLFITVDCVPEANRTYVFDNLRETNFTPQMLSGRIDRICQWGFTPLGNPDYQYHGNFVHDYTFYRMGFINNSEWGGRSQAIPTHATL